MPQLQLGPEAVRCPLFSRPLNAWRAVGRGGHEGVGRGAGLWRTRRRFPSKSSAHWLSWHTDRRTRRMPCTIMWWVICGVVGAADLTAVTVDRSAAPEHRLDKFWQASVGSGHARLGLRADWQRQLAAVHKECGIRGVRFHGSFDDDMGPVVVADPAGGYRYNFTALDVLYDAILTRTFQGATSSPRTTAFRGVQRSDARSDLKRRHGPSRPREQTGWW